jgi:cation transport regulator ChaB
MPYPSIDKLPADVKKALPAKAQETWMGAFNGAKGEGKDEATCAAIAWAAVEKAGWKKDPAGDMWKNHAEEELTRQYKETRDFLQICFPELNLDQDPGKAAIQIKEAFAKAGDFEAEVFSAGKWNGDEYSVADLHDMAKNFGLLQDEIKPPVKLGHNEDGLNAIVRDGQPAYGWVKALRVQGEKLMATFTQVPEILKKAIKAGRYKRVSSEIYWNLKKKSGEVYKRVLGAVAFLGADAPAVTNLKDLEALFTRSTSAAAPGSFERTGHYTFKTEDGSHISSERRANTMLTEEQARAIEEENTRLKASNDELLKSNLTARKKNAADQVRSYCDAQVKGGTMHPSVRDSIMSGIKDGKYMYSDEGEGSFAIPFHTFKTLSDVRKPGGKPARIPGEQRGRQDLDTQEDEDEDEEHDYSVEDGANAGVVVDRKVKKFCAANKVDYSAGLRAVLQSNPKLARAYVESTPLVKHESEASQAADADTEG